MPHILIAEDGPTVMALAGDLLTDPNLTLDVVTDGRSALDRVNANPAAFQMVILGDDLPELSGAQCATFLKRMFRNLTVLMLVSDLTDERRREFGQIGIRPKHLLAKPTDSDTFTTWVKQALLDVPPPHAPRR